MAHLTEHCIWYTSLSTVFCTPHRALYLVHLTEHSIWYASQSTVFVTPYTALYLVYLTVHCICYTSQSTVFVTPHRALYLLHLTEHCICYTSQSTVFVTPHRALYLVHLTDHCIVKHYTVMYCIVTLSHHTKYVVVVVADSLGSSLTSDGEGDISHCPSEDPQLCFLQRNFPTQVTLV